ncbi:MAG: hypothetical protein FJX80_09330 [Bacteroidetes bacterium]|nr:hypothetical protein [Bacteroidota bacterium]
MRFILIILSFLTSFRLLSQDLTEKEKELNKSLLIFREAKTDEEMNELNAEFKLKMLDFLKNDGALAHKFIFCKTISVLDSPDGLIRLITWNIEYTDFSYAFDGVVMYFDDRKEKVKLFELTDIFDPYSQHPTGIIDGKNWYGALYYQMIPFERNGKVEYVLLGWDGGTTGNNFKIIDVMNVTASGVKFGSPVFKEKNTIHKRLVYEFSEQARMTLTFENKYKRIVMDHLSPESQNLTGVKSFYVPDMSYDAYYLEDEMWFLREDIIANNEGDVKKEIREWNNPDEGRPGETVSHVARTPESEVELAKTETNIVPKKVKRNKRQTKNSLKVTTGKYKIKKRRRKFYSE